MRDGDTEPGARTRARVNAIMAMARETDDALGNVRFTARSDGGLVEVEADHNGSIVALRIDQRAPTRARARDLGAQVVQAVNRALREANATVDEFILTSAAAHGVPFPAPPSARRR